MPRTHSNRRPDLETWIASYGVEFEFVPDGPIEDIDLSRSLKNQARIEPLDAPTVERYEIGWATGSVFPPIVVNRTGSRNSKLTIISGNHRAAAAMKCEIATIDRYEVIGAKPATVAAMCREANNFNGLPPSEEERILNAIFASKSQGLSLKAAAELYQVPLSKVQRQFNEASSIQRAQEQGIDLHLFMRLSAHIRSRLVTLDPDEIFKGGVELAIKAALTVDQVKELCVVLGQARSFKAKQGVLATWNKALAEQIEDNLGGRKTNNSRRPMSRRQRFAMSIGQVKHLADDLPLLLEAYSDNEIPTLVDDLEEVVTQLQKMITEAQARA